MSAKDKLLTQEYLKDILCYDPRSGVFTWNFDVSSNAKKGAIAGCTSVHGYRIISLKINGKKYKYFAHRVAWLYMTGEWPKEELDHINRDKIDNKFSNLREATCAQNRFNRIEGKTNKNGFMGVAKRGNKWRSSVTVNGRCICMGTFDTPELAHAAYLNAVRKYHGEFARVA